MREFANPDIYHIVLEESLPEDAENGANSVTIRQEII
jgi:hypothetical protein